MSTELRTPVSRAQGTVDLANRTFRKQILPLTEINYKGRKIKFDRRYLADLAQAFKDKAFPQTPFQLADAENRHTNDPERTRGQMIGVELTADGLDGIFELTEDGVKVIEANPGLGVSARIIENYERADKRTWPRAMQHVLGTLDPRVSWKSKPWEAVQLSTDEAVTEMVDLSTETFGGEEKSMTEKKMVTIELSEEDAGILTQVIEDQRAAAKLAEGTEPPEPEEAEGDEVEGEGDDEDDEGDEGDEQPAPVGLSRDEAAAVELARATAATSASQVLELTNKLRQAEVDREIDRYRTAGLAPAIIEAARPLLELAPQAIELSNGTTLDPGEQARKLLSSMLELAQTGHDVIDLGIESGSLNVPDSLEESRAAVLAQMSNQFGDY